MPKGLLLSICFLAPAGLGPVTPGRAPWSLKASANLSGPPLRCCYVWVMDSIPSVAPAEETGELGAQVDLDVLASGEGGEHPAADVEIQIDMVAEQVAQPRIDDLSAVQAGATGADAERVGELGKGQRQHGIAQIGGV